MPKRVIAALAILAALAGLATVAAPPAAAYTATAQATVNVYERTGPSTSYSAITLLQGGEYFYITCYVVGQSINGDAIWYYGKPNPNLTTQGYVAGYYLTTGKDPNPNTVPCR